MTDQSLVAHARRLWALAVGHNPVNGFYFSQADGCLKGDRWRVFWYGLDDFGRAGDAVAHRHAATLVQ